MLFLIFLILLFIAVVAMIAYGGYQNALDKLKEATQITMEKGKCKEKDVGTCGRKCQKPKPTNCNRCGHTPCQCAHILPGQTKCPMCPGDLKRSVGAGMGRCTSCNRSYRCPGCQMN